MPEQPAAEPTTPHGNLNISLLILSIVAYNFASYLTIGLPLAVLPGWVHDQLGFSAFWAGLVISLQYVATLLSRPHAGRYADLWGPKKVVVTGLVGCLISGLCILLAALIASPMWSLILLCVGRLILGVGQSFTGTGTSLWGVARVGSLHIGRVISWNGIVTYGAMAIGAPLGVVIFQAGGLLWLSLVIVAICVVGIVCAVPRPAVKASRARPLPFRAVLGKIAGFGAILAMGSAGSIRIKAGREPLLRFPCSAWLLLAHACCFPMRLTATAVCGSPAFVWRLKRPDCFWSPLRVIPGWQTRVPF